MATARELLEQADALMRRNRAPQPAPVADDDIPELTEEIELDAPEMIDVPPVAARDLRAPAATLDEIPELTDAVEEIEAPSIVTLPADEGEPSEWLDVDRGEVSITGPAPDSIAAVPPATLHAGADRAFAPRTDAPATPSPAAAALSAAPARAAIAAPVSATALAATFLGAGAATPAAEAPRAPELAPSAPAPASAETLADETIIVVDIPPVAEAPTDEALLEGAPIDEALLEEAPIDEAPPHEALAEEAPVDGLPPDEALPGEPPPDEAPAADERDAAAALAAAAAPPVAMPDAARWDALAEEIRMQVLQRIDIFTDTGMHEQLAARLQPIVDRASADLVTTINQHVGQLLRAYVAEAIEREIEKWRRGGG